jgi:hypothetical protein
MNFQGTLLAVSMAVLMPRSCAPSSSATHAAAALAVEGGVPLYLVQHLFGGHDLAEHLDGVGRAQVRQRLVDVGRQVPVHPDTVVGAVHDVEGAFAERGLQARAALVRAEACLGTERELRLGLDALRVAAPFTA